MSFQMQDHDKAMAYYIKSKKAAILARHFTDTIRINSEIGLEMIAAEKDPGEGIRLCQQSVELAKKMVMKKSLFTP